ncbi:MAG: OmpA family protein [Candidatus Kapabacteria bacterium]|nr:OmpA family protein [Candidatus Kapabacteria bacterium]
MRKIFLLIILFFTLNKVYAQVYADKPNDPRTSYGVFGDLRVNMHSANFPTAWFGTSSSSKLTGVGFGFEAGAFLAIPISSSMELDIKGIYANLGGELTNTENSWVLGPNDVGVSASIEHKITASMASAGLMPLLAYRVSVPLRVYLGLRTSYLIKKDYTETALLTSPSNGVLFDSIVRSRIPNIKPDANAASLDLAAVVGASYDFPLNTANTMFLVPQVFYNLGFSSMADNKSWSVSGLNAGVALRYSPRKIIPPKEPPKPPPPPPIPNPPPPPLVPNLDAEILALGVNDSGVESEVPELIIEEFQRKRTHPILNYVFFEENSSEIPVRYNRISETERNQFSVSRLYNLKTLDVYRHVLNIVGRRMIYYPDANITLIGCNSDEGKERANMNLSKKRAEAVKSYLTNTWSIDPERIVIKSRDLPEVPSNVKDTDGIVENRRVEIIPDNPKIFEPMLIGDTVRESNPPHIRFKMKVSAAIGVKEWRVFTSQSTGDLRTFTGKGEPPKTLDWDLKHEDEQQYSPKLNEPLKYKLEVVDNDNKIWKSNIQELPVNQRTIERKIQDMMDDKIFERYSIIKFPFGLTTMTKEHEIIASMAKTQIKKKSIVTLFGYSDRIGVPEKNMEISNSRALTVARYLGVDPKLARGFGSKELIYDNSLPEGRFYCRTVNIDIVTPVE